MYDDYYYDPEQYPVAKHSRLGIASFLITLGSGMLAFVIVLIAGILEETKPGTLDDDSPLSIGLFLALVGTLGVDLLGLVLGIVGLCLPGRIKVFAILGVVIGILGLVGFVCLMILGMIANA